MNLNLFLGIVTSSSGGISRSILAVGWGSSCPGVVDGVDDVADVVDGVTFAASHAAFSALVSFCPGSYLFPVSPSYNFLWATWNSSEMVELLSLLLSKCLCRTVWITAARQRVGCLGGRTANARWNGLGKHWFMPISSFVSWGVNVVLLHCGCLSLIPFIEFSIWNNSSSSDVLNIQASISISPKFESK